MAPTTLQHRRTHNLLLISKLLNQRDSASPFTLVLDSLEQSAKPLVKEYIRRANVRPPIKLAITLGDRANMMMQAAKIKTLFVSFETLRAPPGIDIFIPTWKDGLEESDWQRDLASHTKPPQTQRTPAPRSQNSPYVYSDSHIDIILAGTLIILDSLTPLCSHSPTTLPSTLAPLLSPSTSLLAVHHLDVPLPTSLQNSAHNSYAPSPLTTLTYLATTILTLHSLPHVLARKAARDRSVVEPSFGLGEESEGVLLGIGANGQEGVVLEMEHRRKSGRGVREWYYLPSPTTSSAPSKPSAVTLLEDHPSYRSAEPTTTSAGGGEETEGTTFELGLTERQRRDREGVVLPYYDAQRGEGPGEGGRILYDMGSEDDFDEEEDEI